MPAEDKRSAQTRWRDMISKWQWWATYNVARETGYTVEAAYKRANKAVKDIKVIKQ